jgi:predicted phosphodiesterase
VSGATSRIAALYDVHGNLPALEAVLEDVRRAGVDQVVVGGDVFPGPMAGETLACLLDLEIPTRFIQGNGDREVLAVAAGEGTETIPEYYRATMRWMAEQLDPQHRRVMASWPKTARLPIEGLGEVLFCHATPRSDVEIFTRRTPEDRLLPVFEGLGGSLVVCGHTHMQFDRTVGDVRVVNAGSVGMPFGDPGAYWLLLGEGVRLRKTDYDLVRAAERIRATGYPQADEFAARNVLRPPSEREILEMFARAELK